MCGALHNGSQHLYGSHFHYGFLTQHFCADCFIVDLIPQSSMIATDTDRNNILVSKQPFNPLTRNHILFYNLLQP